MRVRALVQGVSSAAESERERPCLFSRQESFSPVSSSSSTFNSALATGGPPPFLLSFDLHQLTSMYTLRVCGLWVPWLQPTCSPYFFLLHTILLALVYLAYWNDLTTKKPTVSTLYLTLSPRVAFSFIPTWNGHSTHTQCTRSNKMDPNKKSFPIKYIERMLMVDVRLLRSPSMG